MAKGKQLTKGQKQIVEENASTLKFYSLMTLSGLALHFCFRYFWSGDIPCFSISWSLFAISASAQLGALYCLRTMAKTSYSESGDLLYGGIDLNMEGGVGEYCKDVIIFSTIIQILAIMYRKLWALYIVAPLYTAYKVWITVLMPWFFAPGEDTEKLEKKRLKNQRKLLRIR